MKVMCIGQAAYDITIPVNEYPVENKKIRFDLDKIGTKNVTEKG